MPVAPLGQTDTLAAWCRYTFCSVRCRFCGCWAAPSLSGSPLP